MQVTVHLIREDGAGLGGDYPTVVAARVLLRQRGQTIQIAGSHRNLLGDVEPVERLVSRALREAADWMAGDHFDWKCSISVLKCLNGPEVEYDNDIRAYRLTQEAAEDEN